MLISKFNKMIRNRWVWSVFVVIISLSFVVMFTADGGCQGVDASETSAGTSDGLSVTDSELQRARFFTVLHLSLMTGQPFVIQTPEMRQGFEDMAWSRALSLKKAEALGLRVTNEEIIRQIEQDPMFSANGAFQRHFYDQFANGFLRHIGVSRRHYDDFVRDEILLEKLMRALGSSVWITPYEMDQYLRTYDVFEVQSVRIDVDQLPPAPEPDAVEVEAYYEENQEMFILPERVLVAYVAFPAADFAEGITIDDEQVEHYYTDNLSEFRRAEAELDVSDDIDLPVFYEFDEVADEIRERLIKRQALFEAMDAATGFVLDLVPSRARGTRVSFDELAAERKLTVHEMEPFSRVDPPAEPQDLNPGLLIRHAFRLEDEPEEYFSDAIAGEEAAYVLALREYIPDGVPPLDEVEDTVRDALVQQRTQALLGERAAEIRQEIIIAMQADPDLAFEDAVAELDQALETRSYEPFSIINAPDEFERNIAALRAIIAQNPGELTELVGTPDGRGKLLFLIEQREAPDEMMHAMLRQQIGTRMYSDQAQRIFAEWQDYLLDSLVKTERIVDDRDADEPDRDMGRRPLL